MRIHCHCFYDSISIINCLQQVQSCPAILVTGTSKRDNITLILFQLNWLPTWYGTQYKFLFYTWKVPNGTEPIYVSDMVQIYRPATLLWLEFVLCACLRWGLQCIRRNPSMHQPWGYRTSCRKRENLSEVKNYSVRISKPNCLSELKNNFLFTSYYVELMLWFAINACFNVFSVCKEP